MNIGILALIIGLICAVITLTAYQTDKPMDKAVNYSDLYAKTMPHDI